MKRLPIGVALALAVALMPGLTPHVVRADTIAADAPHPFAVGGGETTISMVGTTVKFHLAFAAQQAGTATPTGHVVWWQMSSDTTSTEKLQIMGPVTCLSIMGNSAQIGISVAQSNFPFISVGETILFDATDNDATQTIPDQGNIVAVSYIPPGPMTCGAEPGSSPLTSGALEVNPGDRTVLTPCLATSTSSYSVDSNCDVSYLTDSGWQTVQ